MNKKVIKQTVFAVAILMVGMVIFVLLIKSRKLPEKKAQQPVVPLLNAQIVKTEDVQVVIAGFGTVQPKVEVTVIPQVSGKIIDCHEDFVNGGFFEADEALIVIEPNDYALAVEQAQVVYEKELAEQKVARLEWDQMHPGEKPTSPLVTRELQLKSAHANLKIAQLALERTIIKMPFSGRVAAESVDIGQFIPAGQPIATVYSTDAVEIAIPLSDKQLAWFKVPGGYNGNGSGSTGGEGSEVKVTAEFAGGSHSWTGKVVRTQGQIDPVSRMVYVVVEVEDPFKLTNSRPALIPNMFVEVDIQGTEIKKVIRVPRYAIRDRNKVWLGKKVDLKKENPPKKDVALEKDAASKKDVAPKKASILKIVEVEIVRMDREYAYVVGGLADGDVVIVSPLDVVTDGMNIRINLPGSN